MARLTRRALAKYVADQLSAGAAVDHLAQQVVAYLVSERRTGELELIIREVEAALLADHLVATVHVRTAHALSADIRQALDAFVRSAEGANQVVIADEKIDDSLIGGLVLRTPNSIFDSSIASQLKQLRSTL